jgi:hypothetical protein
MDYRLATLWPRANYTADKTEIIDVDVIDAISRLVITAEVDNNSKGAADSDGHPVKALSKIELVDGSDVLYSLSGNEGQAVDFYDRGKQNPNMLCYLNGMYSKQIVNINFGRFLFDPELALDPAKFRNLQLKISLDIDAGGWGANDVYLTVLAHLFDEKSASPMGFLMNKEVKDYTMASASHEYTELPLDFPYRQVFLKALKADTMPSAVVDTVKISQDVDRKIPLNHTMLEIIANMLEEWPAYREFLLCQAQTTALYMHITPTYWPVGATSGWSADAPYAYTQMFAGDGGRALINASVAGRNVAAQLSGYAPHGVVPLFPRLREDDKDGYQVGNIKSLKLDVLSKASMTNTVQVLAQQIRSY